MTSLEERQTIARSRFRNVLGNAASTFFGTPTKSSVLAALDQAGVTDEATRQRVVADAQKVAQITRDKGRAYGRDLADTLTLKIELELAQADSLLDGEKIPRTSEQMAADQQTAKDAADAVFLQSRGGYPVEKVKGTRSDGTVEEFDI